MTMQVFSRLRLWIEMSAAFALQNGRGAKRVLPLICGSKDAVLSAYPKLAGLAYRDISEGIDSVAAELAELVRFHDFRDR